MNLNTVPYRKFTTVGSWEDKVYFINAFDYNGDLKSCLETQLSVIRKNPYRDSGERIPKIFLLCSRHLESED